MNDVSVDELAFNCSDFGEHVTKIIERVNLGRTVDDVNSNLVLMLVLTQTKDEEILNKYTTSMSVNTPISKGFADLIDNKLLELAEEAARSYKGQYNA